MKPSTFLKSRLYGFLMIVAGGVLTIALSEAALRLISTNRFYVWPPGLHHTFKAAPEILHGIEGESNFDANNDGLRGDAFSADQTYRILAIGGSTTECLLLDNSEAWPQVLQRTLNSGPSPGSIWVGNAGKRGHNTRNHIIVFEKLLHQYPKIDTALFLVGVNDFGRRLSLDDQYRPSPGLNNLSTREYAELVGQSFSLWPARAIPGSFVEHTELWLKLRAIRNRFRSRTTTDIALDAADVARWRDFRRMASAIRTDLPDLTSALDEYSRNIHTLVDIANRNGVRPIFVTQPHLWRADLSREENGLLWWGGVGRFQQEMGHEYYSVESLAVGMTLYNEALLKICDSRNVECIDLDRRLSKDQSNFYDDMHFNENGAANVARIIGDYLAAAIPNVSSSHNNHRR